MRRFSSAFVALALALLGGAPARAESPAPAEPAAVEPPRAPRAEAPAPAPFGEWTPYRTEMAAGALNPRGVETSWMFGARRGLWRSDSVLLGNTYAIAGLAPALNPSSSRVGPAFEIQPLACFRLSGNAELVQYFATFGNLQGFSSPLADASDAARARTANSAQAARAMHASLEPLLQAKAGVIAVRAHAKAEYWDASLRRGDTVFYAPNLDMLVPNRGFVLSEGAEMLLLPRDGLVLGARVAETHALFRRSDYRPGEAIADPNRQAQAGLLAAWSPARAAARRFPGKPTFFALGGWYLEHRYRASTAAARATPNVVAGVSFELDGAHGR
ncbi:MAG TPA: hypothetical protein VMV18_01245 [bacterium]|nr:hypothetical protein [bacterium]